MEETTFCNTDVNNKNLHIKNGERYERNKKRFETGWFRNLSSFSHLSMMDYPIVTIPVVVHVLYKQEIENISDEQIHSQIDVLNKEFRNQNNNDIDKVPEVWRHLVADTRIEFKLAVKDPEGKPTTGITRTKTDNEEFLHGTDSNREPLPENMKHSEHGGKGAWDTSRNLNIWVCNLLSSDDGQIMRGVIGYAQFPDVGDPDEDGLVMRYDAFGTVGEVRPPLHLGRVTVHEIGHYLGLYHIWGDVSDIPEDNLCSMTGDNIEDTPNQSWFNRGKPRYPSNAESCPDTDREHGTMFMNHMDYTDDEIRCMFTLGQTIRMRYTLQNSRRLLIQNDVLISPKEQSSLSDLRKLPPKAYDGVGETVKIEKLL